MELLIDTRQHHGKHMKKFKYFTEHGIKTYHCCLPYGDYMLLPEDFPADLKLKLADLSRSFLLHNNISAKDRKSMSEWLFLRHEPSIDTKKGMEEVYQNLIHDRERFKKECEKGGENLIFLIEDVKIKGIDDIMAWRLKKPPSAPKGKRPPVPGSTLHKMMLSYSRDYGIEWKFCTPSKAGSEIMRILCDDQLRQRNQN